ncbi:methylated-DNA--[protein]-cysteine S-methyltransferase [Clostridiaceae bacterium]|nr:methylated-DNA--[protein]-cysteine S-methyltransferase [Clostridiaceae bacterium]RKI11085.1 methylated-DNA--[protein]-cysteine S-methyltransferase [bacterium 1XD21-70]
MQHITTYESPIGKLFLAEKAGALTGLWIEGQKYFMGSLKEETKEQGDSPVLGKAKKWLDRYFAGEKPSVGEWELAPAGSGFYREVWEILCGIPYGEVTTYKAIAQKAAARRGLLHMSAQAVGQAVGHNPISIIIPCHRVVGADKSLTGYAGGIEKKIYLLTLEGVDVEGMAVPKKGTAL